MAMKIGNLANKCKYKRLARTIFPLPLAIALFFVSSFSFAEEPPISGSGWHYALGGTKLNGRYFYDVSESYREQDGHALVQGRRLHYWLYNTVLYHDGNADEIYNRYIPHWVEKMGYVIDFDNIQIINPNPQLASSVRALMQQRGCDVSVALVTDNSNYVVINEHFKSKGTYKTTIYYLYK
jgi:hypothetical protein